jgi:hypothetical protein
MPILHDYLRVIIMKLYVNKETGEAFKSKDGAFDSAFVKIGNESDLPESRDLYRASDVGGDEICSPYIADVLMWGTGRQGVTIRVLHVGAHQ